MMHARMNLITRLLPRCLLLSLALTLAVGGVDARGQQISNKPLINITGYVIDLALQPATHEMHATARVSFTALDTVPVATFELHSALKVAKVTDENGHALNAERGQASTIRVTPQSPLAKGDKAVWAFTYEGALEGVEGSPVEALKLAAIEDPISCLLYPAK